MEVTIKLLGRKSILNGSAFLACPGKAKSASVKGEEVGYVDQVTLIGSKTPGLQRVNIKMRYNRNPVIGDKFSSRHGQKGVLSQLWKDVDMPFCPATGMRCGLP